MELPTASLGRTCRKAIGFFVGSDSLGERISMNAKDFGGSGKVFLMAFQSLLNVELLEFRDGLLQENLAVQHLIN
jgi:hypothetical protein